MLEAFVDYQSDGLIQRDSLTWIDLAQRLAQRMSPGEIVTREDLHILVDRLQNPGSELYIKGFEIIMNTFQ